MGSPLLMSASVSAPDRPVSSQHSEPTNPASTPPSTLTLNPLAPLSFHQCGNMNPESPFTCPKCSDTPPTPEDPSTLPPSSPSDSPSKKLTTQLPQTYAACNPSFNYAPAANPKRVLTKPSKPALNEGWDNAENDYILYVNDVLGNRDDQQLSTLRLKRYNLVDEGTGTGDLWVWDVPALGWVCFCGWRGMDFGLDKGGGLQDHETSLPRMKDASADFGIVRDLGRRFQYHILDLLGQGTFGQVVKCMNIKTRELVAVKVIKNKPAYYNQSLVEVAILDILNNKWDQSDKYHIVGMKDTFLFRNHLCIVFEMLSANLYELIKQNQFRGLSTNLVRVFVKQILECLVLLSKAKIIHSDLKPENILLKTLTEPEIKVIDFGSACHENQTIYTYIQSRFYRSPEVLVGLPYTSSIDIWSLGCIAAELFLGLPLFPGTSEYNQICRIVGVLGMPQQWMCDKGKNAKNFFVKREGSVGYQLKTIEEYVRDTGLTEQPSKRYFAGNTLEEIINSYPMPKKEMNSADLEKELNNRRCLLDFLGGLLKLNPLERWSPQQAKMHPFVTGEPFTAPFATSPAFRLQPSVFQSPSPTAPVAGDVVNNVPAVLDVDSPASTSSNTPSVVPTVSAAPQRRPRANTMIQAVPPQLQKIVSMQQHSGPNKMSLRNAAASTTGNIPGNAKPLSTARSSMNNDDCLYSPDQKPLRDHESDVPPELELPGGVRDSQQQNTKNHPLRKAVSESVHVPQQHSSSQLGGSPLANNSMPIAAESLSSLQTPTHGPQMIYYEGSHIPYTVLENLNPGGPSDPAQQNYQQHPRTGEKGERKSALASRAPSLPGLAEWDPFGNIVENSNGPRMMPNAEQNGIAAAPYDMGQRRMSLNSEAQYGNASPRFRIQQGYSFPSQNQNVYSSSPRNAFPSSPRNSYHTSQQSPYSQQPVPPPGYSASSYHYPAQSGLGVYEEVPASQTEPNVSFRNRSVSLSMHGQFPLNQLWNQPMAPPPQQQQHLSHQQHHQQHHQQQQQHQHQHQHQQQQQQQQQSRNGNGKKRPPSISTALGTSPQHFQQPFSAAPGHYASLSANSNGYYPSALSANHMNASNPDMSGIPPQRINHPANLGMRRQSVQYGSTPPTYSSSYHNSGVRGSSSLVTGPPSAGLVGGPIREGNSMEFPKTNIPQSSSMSTSGLSGGRAQRFSNLPPAGSLIGGDDGGEVDDGGGGDEQSADAKGNGNEKKQDK
ncbi:dual specificity protein kinase yak1 [Rhizoclosmatium hyalinum]|nr:dual specificity protein kinase yak1 [Rhizoclosmatium hyalinum]